MTPSAVMKAERPLMPLPFESPIESSQLHLCTAWKINVAAFLLADEHIYRNTISSNIL